MEFLFQEVDHEDWKRPRPNANDHWRRPSWKKKRSQPTKSESRIRNVVRRVAEKIPRKSKSSWVKSCRKKGSASTVQCGVLLKSRKKGFERSLYLVEKRREAFRRLCVLLKIAKKPRQGVCLAEKREKVSCWKKGKHLHRPLCVLMKNRKKDLAEKRETISTGLCVLIKNGKKYLAEKREKISTGLCVLKKNVGKGFSARVLLKTAKKTCTSPCLAEKRKKFPRLCVLLSGPKRRRCLAAIRRKKDAFDDLKTKWRKLKTIQGLQKSVSCWKTEEISTSLCLAQWTKKKMFCRNKEKEDACDVLKTEWRKLKTIQGLQKSVSCQKKRKKLPRLCVLLSGPKRRRCLVAIRWKKMHTDDLKTKRKLKTSASRCSTVIYWWSRKKKKNRDVGTARNPQSFPGELRRAAYPLPNGYRLVGPKKKSDRERKVEKNGSYSTGLKKIGSGARRKRVPIPQAYSLFLDSYSYYQKKNVSYQYPDVDWAALVDQVALEFSQALNTV